MERKMPAFSTTFRPQQIQPSAFIADNAKIVGDVTIAENASVWFGAVIRGDTESIVIGEGSNVQDLSLLHADSGVICRLGKNVTVGHAAIVHGAIIGDDCMIGMRATLLNHVQIGKGSLIAAGSLVTEGTIIPPGSVVMGSPATVRRQVTPKDTQRIQHAASHYVKLAQAYKKSQG